MALGRPLGAKLFLEGMEVPFLGATITCAVDQASIAYVDLIPHQIINDIKPRTKVDIFVRNYQDDSGTPGVDSFPYVLAWEGEVFGINLSKTPTSRNFSISCIDDTGYWDNCLAYYFNSQQCLGAGMIDKSSQALEISDVQADGERIINVIMSQASYFETKIREIVEPTKDLADGDPKKKDFLDAFVALYEDIGYINDFFRSAEDRLRIKDRIQLHSSGKLYELIKETTALEWFVSLPGKSSGYTTLRLVIQDLMAMIFHDFVSVPFPALTSTSRTFTLPKAGITTTGGGTKTIGSFVFKPNLYMMPPPACNIFFPDEYSSYQFSRNFFKEPTRLIYMPELPARLKGGTPAVVMPHVYEPPSYNYFMNKNTGGFSNYQDNTGTGVPTGSNPGHYGDTDDSIYKATNAGSKREAQFLTNEEYIKGIIMSRENMMPMTTQFRTSLDQFADEKKTFTKRIAKYLFYKKRFQDRQLQITSHLKLSVVPGFPVLILDDSDSDQNMVAYCSSVTHRIYANEGGYTNVQLTYARQVAEQDVSSTYGAQYLVPPWFEESIFGTVTTPPESKAAPDRVAAGGITLVATDKLSTFYETLLGKKGNKAVTNMFKNEKTLVGSVTALLNDYRAVKAKGTRDVQEYISRQTSRDYVKMKQYYEFLLATTNTKQVEISDWIEFKGEIFTRKGKLDEKAVATRRSVITEYRDALQAQRGFRG